MKLNDGSSLRAVASAVTRAFPRRMVSRGSRSLCLVQRMKRLCMRCVMRCFSGESSLHVVTKFSTSCLKVGRSVSLDGIA